MSDEKYVGPIAAAKNVVLVKAELNKKLDKSGGTVTGSLEINGDIHAGGAVQSDLLLSAPSVTVHNDAVGASVHINCSGDNAAGISCLDSGGKSHYARLAVGTPTGDNDATTKAYVDGRTHDYYDVTVISAADAAQTIDGGIISVRGSADKTVSEIAAAYAAGAIVRCIYGGNIMPLVRAEDGSYSFAGTGANYGVARDGNIVITIMSTSNGDTTLITSAAGELPIPDSDVSQNGCALVVRDGQWMYSEDKLIPATPTSNGLMSKDDKAKLDGVEAGATKTTVDAALDANSTNPVQNKVIKAALDKKLSTQGGEISGSLSVGLTVSAEGSVSTGKTSTDTGIHFEKAGSDVGRISHGSDPMTGVAPIARLKVASPTEDDDAATKAYVDGSAVRYDAAQELEFAQKGRARRNIDAAGVDSPQFQGFLTLSPANETLGSGVGLSPTGSGHKYTLDISDVDEGNPTLLTGVKTPTDANTNAAANVEYVKAKIAEAAASGGVDVDNALSATSTNPVQNKVITSALTGKAGTAVATQSANGLMSKADKTKLDGIAAGATKVTVDSAMSASSTNPVQNKVVKQYVDDKVAAAGSNITVDTSLSSTSTNPVQNKAVKAAIDAKADKTALDGKLDKTGGTLTGNLIGKYITGTWLQSTAAANLGKTPGKIAVLDDAGWVYYRTPAEILADIGAAAAGHTHDCYTKAETDAAIAVRASTSAYGTTKLSNSTTSSSKTVAATPYAVKTALAKAKAYVDSAIAVAINSAY